MKSLKSLAACLLAATLAAHPAVALHPSPRYVYPPEQYEQILIPIFTQSISDGAYGSRWTESVTIHNSSSQPVKFEPYFLCGGCPGNGIAAGATATLHMEAAVTTSSFPGLLLYLPRLGAGSLTISNRVHELTRAAMTWGTTIPVVREADWRTRTAIQLPSLPLGDPSFRTLVRVYAAETWGCDECSLPMQIRIYEQSGNLSAADRLVGQTAVTIGFHHFSSGFTPAYAQLGDLAAHVSSLRPDALYRVEIAPDADVRFWAFASVTNNESQHVTVVTPATTEPGTAVATVQIHFEDRSGAHQKREEVITSPERWQAVWEEIVSDRSPKPPLPAVDFTSQVLIYVARGETGDACRWIRIRSVELRRGHFEVTVDDTRRPASCVCPPVTVQPVHIVAVPRVATTATFRYESGTRGQPCN